VVNAFKQNKKIPQDRIAKLKSNPDGFSDLFLHQHFLYVLGNRWREIFMSIHISILDLESFYIVPLKATCATIKLELLWTAVKMEKKYHAWNIFILLYTFHSVQLA
jgi:hypothetical protein